MIQKLYVIDREIRLASLMIQKCYVTDRGTQLASLMIQKRYVTDRGIQLTCVDPKTLGYRQGDATDLLDV